jgi:hypothetical protein
VNSAQATEPAYARRRISGAARSRAERMDLRASDKPRGLTAQASRRSEIARVKYEMPAYHAM